MRNFRRINISIPYGAIKSHLIQIHHHSYMTFQFLMVRLKDEYTVEWMRVYDISIPYGAIKSKLHHHNNKTFVNFNSLWCD